MTAANHLRQRVFWKMVSILQTLDYAIMLPLISRLPLFLGYAFSALRGKSNGLLGIDWRTAALKNRFVLTHSTTGFRMLFPNGTRAQIKSLVRERFETECREEFEGRLISAGRVAELNSQISPAEFIQTCMQRERGLLLLTPHFDSFMLGIAFLGMTGMKINVMTSAITNNPKVNKVVSEHFFKKYRGMERVLNGGRMLDREIGLRPFYHMLKRGECLVILADAPATPGGAVATPLFLGVHRQLAGGALRIAGKTGSDLGAFVCRHEGRGQYQVVGGPILNAANPSALDTIYGFLSDQILASPGRWWAADLLMNMPAINDAKTLSHTHH